MPVVGGAFVDWVRLFIAPLENLDMLWIIVPIWASWLFAEFFQEKKGTSFGNAISNGVVMLFVGIDWVRYVIRQVDSGAAVLGAESFVKIGIASVIIFLGLLIVLLGIRAKQVVRFIGRVREVSYLMLMFTPVVYGVVDFTPRIFLVIMAFLPVFYILVELIDRFTPTPKIYGLEEGEKDLGSLGLGKEDSSLSGLGQQAGLSSDFGRDVFGSQSSQSSFPSQPPFSPAQPSQQPQHRLNRRF